jgi:hypothetical protein
LSGLINFNGRTRYFTRNDPDIRPWLQHFFMIYTQFMANYFVIFHTISCPFLGAVANFTPFKEVGLYQPLLA